MLISSLFFICIFPSLITNPSVSLCIFLIKMSVESAKKLKDATQIQGKVTKVPAGQKGMRLPAKGETVKRKKGGKVMSGQDFVNSFYD